MDDRKVVVHRLEDHGLFEPYVIRVITVLERTPAGLVEVATAYLSRWDGIVGEEVGATCAWAGEELLCSLRYDTSVISLRAPEGW